MTFLSTTALLCSTGLSVVPSFSPPARAATDLVAAYAFDEGTGTVAGDASGNGHVGTLVNGANWSATNKKYGAAALNLDGSNDRVDVSDSNLLDLTNGMTVEAWVRPTTNASAIYRTVVLKEVPGELAYALYAVDPDHGKRPSGWVRTNNNSQFADATTTLALNTWTHISTTYNGSLLKFFVNGVEVRSKAVTGNIQVSANPLRVGGNTVWGEYFRGQIDDIRIYSRALSAAEITTDMNTPVSSSPDTTPPTVSITTPANNATVFGAISVTANASDNVGVVGVQFKLDGANLGAEDATAPFSVSWDTLTASEGAHQLTAVARDAAGNTATSSVVNVTVDNIDETPPSISITSPADGASVSGNVTVAATASDNVGVSGVQFLLDGANLGAEDTASPYSIIWDTQAATNGAHVLTARARDAAGNTAMSSSVNVTVVPDFSFTVLTPSRTVETTGGTDFRVEVVYVNGFTSSNVDLWFTGLPAGVTGDYLFDPMSHQGQTQLLITTSNAAVGTYPFTMGATAEGITHSQQATLVITNATDFQLAASPSTQNVTAGNATTFTISLTETNDFTNPVTLSVLGLPSGATASFNPPTPTPAATSTLTISTATSTPVGTYNLTVQGVAGSVTRTTPITLSVTSTSSVWTVETMGTTGVQNNNVRVGKLRTDGLERVYVGTIATGRMLEYSRNGSSWSGPIDVGGSPGGSEIHNVTIGAGRGDGKDRLYAASLDNNIYEIWYDGTGWQQMTVGSVGGQAMHAAVGIGRNDGVTRLYAISTGQLYEFTWNGANWTRVLIGNTPGAHGVAVGQGRNDGQNYVYVASISSGTFEARYVGGAWTIAGMGDSGDVRDVELGVGRNDGVIRVYVPLYDGRAREFTWNGTSWTFVNMPSTGTQSIHAYIAPGRNDGINRVYISNGNGKAWEYSWDGATWQTYNMGGGSDYMYGLHYGKGRNDGLIRFYGADRGSVNQVYEYTWVTPDTIPPTAPTSLTGSGGVGTASLSWTASTDNVAVTNYNVHRSTTSGFTPSSGNRVGQPTGTSFTDTGLAAGTYYYKVTAQDAAGNISGPSNEASTTVTSDTTPPTVSITSPADGATVSNTITVAADASDDVAVAGVQFLLDGANLGAEDTTSPYSLSWNTTNATNGPHTLTARARDTGGNSTLSSAVSVTVFNDVVLRVHPSTPPRVSGTDPVTTAAFNPPDNSLLLALVSSDAGSNNDPDVSITNNGTALTWTMIGERSKNDAGANDGEASAFYALLPAGRTGMTVSATVTDQNPSLSLKVYVVTGHNAATPIGATGEGSSTTNDLTPTIYTSAYPNSLGFGVANDWNATGLPSSTDEEDAFHMGGLISGLSAYKAATTSAAGTPVTMNFDGFGSAATQWNWVGFEVRP